MKPFVCSLAFLLISLGTIKAQEMKTIPLSKPSSERGCDIMKAFRQRQSVRTFDSKALSLQDLSDLLWAANGINRPESGKRTAPSAVNSQDIDIYVCQADGAYLYDASQQALKQITATDVRPLIDGNRPSGAPHILLLVADMSKYRNYKEGDEAANKHLYEMGALDAGIVSENIGLFCAASNLATVPRAGMNKEALQQALHLKPSQILWLNHPVGYQVTSH